MEKYKHSKQILDQLERSKKAMPSDAFLSKMEKLAEAYSKVNDVISMRTVLTMAASFILLLAANFLIMNDHLVQDSMQNSQSEESSNYTMVPAKSIYNE